MTADTCQIKYYVFEDKKKFASYYSRRTWKVGLPNPDSYHLFRSMMLALMKIRFCKGQFMMYRADVDIF